MTFQVKRVYDDPAPSDGCRVLVDRLWPRGVSSSRAALDLWAKDVAPSTALRTWFHANPTHFTEFADRYRTELATNPAVADLLALARDHGTVTLLYGSREAHENHAVVLAAYLAG